MSSESVAYGERWTEEVWPGEVAADITPDVDRGKDWPLALAVFVPVLAAYGTIGYGAFSIASMLA